MAVKQPELPDWIDWPKKTLQWWAALADTPGADTWSASDWEFLASTALIHADIWGDSNFDRLNELRVREEEMGITPSARKRIGIGDAQEENEVQTRSPLEEIAEERRLSLHVTRSPRKTGT